MDISKYRIGQHLDTGGKVVAKTPLEETKRRGSNGNIIMKTVPDGFVPILHRECGEVCFFYAHWPTANEMIASHLAYFPDGSRPDRGQPFYCGSCGERVYQMKDLIWRKKEYVQTRLSQEDEKLKKTGIILL